MTTYKNKFRAIIRRYIGDTGYTSLDGGVTWSENKTPEALIKNLPYYKEVKHVGKS